MGWLERRGSRALHAKSKSARVLANVSGNNTDRGQALVGKLFRRSRPHARDVLDAADAGHAAPRDLHVHGADARVAVELPDDDRPRL